MLNYLGECVTDSTEKNLSMRVEAEYGATAGKFDIAKRAKMLGFDAIHDTVHEMAKDEARHGKSIYWIIKQILWKIIIKNRELGENPSFFIFFVSIYKLLA